MNIEGYEYQGAYYDSYTSSDEHGDAISTIEANRTSRIKEESGSDSLSYSSYGYSNEDAFDTSDHTYYQNDTLTQQLYWRQRLSNSRWYFYTSATGNTRYSGNKVYYATSGTKTYYTTTVTFSGENEPIEELISEETTSTDPFATGKSIYLVYKSTSDDQKKATIHWGTYDGEEFIELKTPIVLDTAAYRIR